MEISVPLFPPDPSRLVTQPVLYVEAVLAVAAVGWIGDSTGASCSITLLAPLVILLSTLFFSSSADQKLVQTLLTFATIPGRRLLENPRQLVVLLVDEYEPTH